MNSPERTQTSLSSSIETNDICLATKHLKQLNANKIKTSKNLKISNNNNNTDDKINNNHLEFIDGENGAQIINNIDNNISPRQNISTTTTKNSPIFNHHQSPNLLTSSSNVNRPISPSKSAISCETLNSCDLNELRPPDSLQPTNSNGSLLSLTTTTTLGDNNSNNVDKRGSVASSSRRHSGGKKSRIVIRKFQKLDLSQLSSTPAPEVKIGQRVAYKEYYGNEFGTIRWIGKYG